MLFQIERNMEMNPKFETAAAQDGECVPFQVSYPRRSLGFRQPHSEGSSWRDTGLWLLGERKWALLGLFKDQGL